jgi:hypothetical protein
MSSYVTRPRGTSSEEEEKDHQDRLRYSREAYHALVADGCQPGYPLTLLEDLVRDPPEYHGGPRLTWLAQLSRWEDFRWFQRFARGQSVEENYRDAWGQKSFVPNRRWQRFKENYGDEEVVYVSGQYWIWDSFLESQRPTTGEEGRFPVYSKAVKERLRRHGFTRMFQLDKDPTRQDKLTTWIEYLAYEYWWYDRRMLSKRQQRRHDEAWRKLVDSGVLTSSDTEEFICSMKSAFLEQVKERRAKASVESAKSDTMRIQKALSDPRRITRSKRWQQDLREAQARLDMAVKAYEPIKRRHDLLFEFARDTNNYRIAKEDAERQRILVQWVLQQVPSIELELKQSDTIAKNLGGEIRSSSLRPEGSGHLGEGQDRTENSKNQPTSDRRMCVTPTASQRPQRRKRRSDDSLDGERPSKHPRYYGQTRDFCMASGPQNIPSSGGPCESVATAAQVRTAVRKQPPRTGRKLTLLSSTQGSTANKKTTGPNRPQECHWVYNRPGQASLTPQGQPAS